jgi:hypothetical protein
MAQLGTLVQGPKRFRTGSNLTTAQTDASGGTTTNMVTVATASANGSTVAAVDIKALSSTVASQIRFFVHDGSSAKPIGDTVTVTALTPSGTVAPFNTTWYPPGGSLDLATGETLRATTYDTQSFYLNARGTDYA